MTHENRSRFGWAAWWRRAGRGFLCVWLSLSVTAPRAAESNPTRNGVDTAPISRNFTLEEVVDRARDLAAHPFDASVAALPPELEKLDYDHYRRIVFRRDKSFLNDRGAFALQLMHLGFIYRRPVVISIIRDAMVRPIPYSSSLFDYAGNKFTRPFPINLGFAGLRILYPLRAPNRMDELISFLGGTAFRVLGRDTVYGLSARALAIKPPGSGDAEEVPFFREIWVRQPAATTDRIELYALLDTPSAAGAFRFEVVPGKTSAVEVTMTLFARKAVDGIGLAPLTSMFFTGENDRRLMGNDFRPEVHDSDGVLLHTGTDEWLWRPLHNPLSMRTSKFFDTDPRGFGLLQRDRTFDHYGDLDAHYERRPGYWIEPAGQWGKGAVDLVELPASHEGADNVTLFWRPETPLAAGGRLDLRYRLSTVSDTELHPLAWASATFETTPGAGKTADPAPPNIRRFLIDFRGGDLAYYLGDPAKVKVDAWTSTGRVVGTAIAPNGSIDGFRASVDIDVEPGKAADLRAVLRSDGRPLSETWTYEWISPPAAQASPQAATQASKAAGAR